MIPAQFDYVRPGSLAEACQELASDEDAKVLAGGQSLLPLMRLRMAYPSKLVDIGRLPDLKGVHDRGDHVFIGAMTTHDEVLHSGVVRADCPLLALATAQVADPAIRHRGTFGGSLAHADPAGDLPAVVLALEGVFVARSQEGEREIPAAEFFVDYWESSLGPGEILVGCGSRSWAPAGASTTRSSTGPPRRGRSSAWPPPSGAPTARSPRPGSG